MNSIEYQELIKRVERSEILIGVEPAVARKFFTDTDCKVIQQTIGETLSIKRFFVKTVWILEYIFLLAGIIASIFALHWYCIIAIPLMIAGFFILGGMASAGTQRLRGAIWFVILCGSLAYSFSEKGLAIVIWLSLLPLPYFFARMTYKLATIFVRGLSIRNEKVFNMLYGKAIFLKENNKKNCN